MTFLEPLLLAALPLIAVPIVIHLINRRRYRSIAWGPMMFLLDARKRTRGRVRLRHWVIMALRVCAVAALILAAAQPLATGRLGLALGGTADTALVLLDRSASMEQQDLATGTTKRAAALARLKDLLNSAGRRARVVLIDSGQNRPEPIDSVNLLDQLPSTAATDTTADIPAMLLTALDYIQVNRTGRTDIWICSDLKWNDWQPEDGRWKTVRDGFAKRDGINFYLLTYQNSSSENLSVTVSRLRRHATIDSSSLVLDVDLQSSRQAPAPQTIPLEFTINGARSVLNAEVTDSEYSILGHTITLADPTRGGWGRVDLPVDSNLRDNAYFFVYGSPTPRRTVIVAEDATVATPLRLAAESPPEDGIACSATVVSPAQVADIDWDHTCLILWQAPLPDDTTAALLTSYVASGRPVIFFPPARVSAARLFGFSWQEWKQEAESAPCSVSSWRNDSDLLRRADSGAALPVGDLQIYRHCLSGGTGQSLAQLSDGSSLLTRHDVEGGPVYCFATLPRSQDSNLLHRGVVFYVLIQRALKSGADALSSVSQITAGSEAARSVIPWASLSPLRGHPADLRSLQAGVFAHGDRMVAVNRPPGEDAGQIVEDEQVAQLFGGLSMYRLDDNTSSTTSLMSEVWRTFICLMGVTLLIEAWLCLPGRRLPGRRDAASFSSYVGEA